jgi:flagellar assembly protein FliH
MNRWTAPVISGRTLAAVRGMTTSDELQGAEREAWLEAEAAGRAAGLATAQRQFDVKLRQADELCLSLQSALNRLSRPLAHVDDDVYSQIAQLAVAVARGIVRRELRVDPSQVIGIVRETVSLLPASARGVRVVLHPEDAALVRERLPASGPDSAWSISEDPVLARGDCRVLTDFAQIDARVESRLNEALAALLGEDRAQSRGTQEA